MAPRLVTPEAVVLQFETAGLGSRLLAAVIDVFVQGTVLFLTLIASAAFFARVDVAGTVAVVVLLLAIMAILFGYPIAFETLWRGRTLGKAALGLRVVTKEGAPVRFRHAVVRGFLGLVDFYLTTGGAAVLSVLFSRNNQRLGDLAAGTLVLRERSGAGRPVSVQFPVPYGYEPYVVTLDTTGLTADEYGAVRSFLLRAASLPPEVRGTLELQLATTVAARIRHQPPPGVTPEAFLLCVAAAHQARSATVDPGPQPSSQAWAPAADVWAGGVPAVARPAPMPVPTPISEGGFQAPG